MSISGRKKINNPRVSEFKEVVPKIFPLYIILEKKKIYLTTFIFDKPCRQRFWRLTELSPLGNSLVVLSLLFCAATAGGTGSVPDQGTNISLKHGASKKKKKKELSPPEGFYKVSQDLLSAAALVQVVSS